MSGSVILIVSDTYYQTVNALLRHGLTNGSLPHIERLTSLQEALDFVNARTVGDVRILVTDHGNACKGKADPASQGVSNSERLAMIKAKATELGAAITIIGITPDTVGPDSQFIPGQFSQALIGYGCDVTCDPERICNIVDALLGLRRAKP